jgi:hypothetical protein
VELFGAPPGCGRALFQRRIFRHWRTSVWQKLAQLCRHRPLFCPLGRASPRTAHRPVPGLPRTTSKRRLATSAPYPVDVDRIRRHSTISGALIGADCLRLPVAGLEDDSPISVPRASASSAAKSSRVSAAGKTLV